MHVSWSTSELRVSLVPWNIGPPLFLLTVPRRCFFCGSFCYLCFVFVFVMLSRLSPAALQLPAEQGLTSWLSCVLCFIVFLSFSHLVSRVMCGKCTWLYRFLTFAYLLITFTILSIYILSLFFSNHPNIWMLC